ncbi:MAG: dual specificity protein phosphatase family protein [Candidatus Competibacter sp.]|nr:dual specificity protein phosphatase family protein [Candidatus Competibacter sp.]MDG4583199.1 dual specificity protein phosphatase family protein [Candidatus Competibacter sp.]
MIHPQIPSPAWFWRLNWDTIRPDLVLGSCPRDPTDLDRLQSEARISAVLSLQHDECLEKLAIDYPRLARHGRALGLLMERGPMRDFDPEDQRRRLPEAVRTLHALLGQGHRVYLHCTAGINRSSLVAVAYLTWIEGQPLDEAMALLQRARPEVSPYWDAYEGCGRDLLARHARQIRQRADELGRQNPGQSAEVHRLQAEREIIRVALVG